MFNTIKEKVKSLGKKKTLDATTSVLINQYNTKKQISETKIGDADKKIPDMSGSVTATVQNTKISKVENKIPNASSLVVTNYLNIKSVKLRIKFLMIYYSYRIS